mgnify:CR=1 FL=1
MHYKSIFRSFILIFKKQIKNSKKNFTIFTYDIVSNPYDGTVSFNFMYFDKPDKEKVRRYLAYLNIINRKRKLKIHI